MEPGTAPFMTPESKRPMNAKGWLKLSFAVGAGFSCGLWLSVHYPLSLPFWN
jgi:hypothetical protein